MDLFNPYFIECKIANRRLGRKVSDRTKEKLREIENNIIENEREVA